MGAALRTVTTTGSRRARFVCHAAIAGSFIGNCAKKAGSIARTPVVVHWKGTTNAGSSLSASSITHMRSRPIVAPVAAKTSGTTASGDCNSPMPVTVSIAKRRSAACCSGPMMPTPGTTGSSGPMHAASVRGASKHFEERRHTAPPLLHANHGERAVTQSLTSSHTVDAQLKASPIPSDNIDRIFLISAASNIRKAQKRPHQ